MTFTTRFRFGAAVVVAATALTVAAPAWAAAPSPNDPQAPSRLADLKALPPNDLASSPIADELRAAGAFRADVTGAGPAVYGLFTERDRAAVARELFTDRCETWLTAPAW